MKKNYTVGFRSEILGLVVGKVQETPVGILTLRINPKENKQPFSVMLDRPALERLVEDISHLLKNSKMLQTGEHQSVTLSEVESLHSKLTD